MKTLRSLCPVILVLGIVNVTALAGGERSNIRGMGMGRTFTASSRGLDAVGINPANLSLPEAGTVTFSIIPFGVHVGSDLFNYDMYNTYFTGVQTDSGRSARYLTDQDKQDILDRFTGGGARTMADLEARLFGLSLRFPSFGTFAFVVNEHIGGYVDVPRDYLEFILYGNLPGKILDFSSTKANASWIREYALTFSKDLPQLPFVQSATAGITLKHVQGVAYFEVERFNTSMVTSSNGALTANIGFASRFAGADIPSKGIGARYSVFPQPVGTGFGVDIGVSASLNDAVSIGLSITDIGSIQWTDEIEEMHADTVITVDDPLDVTQRDNIEQSLNGEKRTGNPFSTSLPTTLRLGVAVQVDQIVSWIPGQLLVAADYNQGFVDMVGSTPRARFSVGMEYKLIRWFPIRAGMSMGGTDHLNYALGFGLNFGVFDLDLG